MGPGRCLGPSPQRREGSGRLMSRSDVRPPVAGAAAPECRPPLSEPRGVISLACPKGRLSWRCTMSSASFGMAARLGQIARDDQAAAVLHQGRAISCSAGRPGPWSMHQLPRGSDREQDLEQAAPAPSKGDRAGGRAPQTRHSGPPARRSRAARSCAVGGKPDCAPSDQHRRTARRAGAAHRHPPALSLGGGVMSLEPGRGPSFPATCRAPAFGGGVCPVRCPRLPGPSRDRGFVFPGRDPAACPGLRCRSRRRHGRQRDARLMPLRGGHLVGALDVVGIGARASRRGSATAPEPLSKVGSGTGHRRRRAWGRLPRSAPDCPAGPQRRRPNLGGGGRGARQPEALQPLAA